MPLTARRLADPDHWSLASAIRVLSMDAERAARRLVSATLRGRAEVVLTPAAKLGVRVHALAPGLTMRTVAAVERLLPRPLTLDGGGARPEPGHATGRQPGWFARLTRLDRDAAHRWHEVNDPA